MNRRKFTRGSINCYLLITKRKRRRNQKLQKLLNIPRKRPKIYNED